VIIDAHAHIMSEICGRTGAGPTRSLSYGKVLRGEGEVIRLVPPLCGAQMAFPPEALLEFMDWIGVDKAVLLQGSFYGTPNEYVRQAVAGWPDRFIGAAFVDPRAGDARETFHHCVEKFGFRVVKFELSEDAGLTGLYPDLRLDEPELAWFWEEAEARDLVVTLDLGYIGSRSYQTDAVRNVLAEHSALRIVIAHLAHPPVSRPDDAALNELWRDQLLLARDGKVWFDLAALPVYSRTEDYPYPTAQRYVREAVELIGVDRLMWGTDIPGLLSHATYRQLLDFVARHCAFLSKAGLAKVLGGNAQQVYAGP